MQPRSALKNYLCNERGVGTRSSAIALKHNPSATHHSHMSYQRQLEVRGGGFGFRKENSHRCSGQRHFVPGQSELSSCLWRAGFTLQVVRMLNILSGPGDSGFATSVNSFVTHTPLGEAQGYVLSGSMRYQGARMISQSNSGKAQGYVLPRSNYVRYVL